MGPQLERLQAQNSMLQKVSRKLQEEVRLLRSGNSLPGADVGEAESLDSLNQLESQEGQEPTSPPEKELQT